ncbi:MAG: DUF2970 domain-containing protein [Burkholderiales bacterium]|nr:DUF2970 domain-containing protein [Burkholderiales bacterium]
MAETRQKATLLQVVRMVFSAFLGIRKRAEHEKIEVSPLQVIIVGIMAAAIFVITVVSVVRLVVG